MLGSPFKNQFDAQPFVKTFQIGFCTERRSQAVVQLSRSILDNEIFQKSLKSIMPKMPFRKININTYTVFNQNLKPD